MKTSCIKHPSDDYYIIIRAWQRRWCAENGVNEKAGPALLSLFEYLYNSKMDLTKGRNGWVEISIQDMVARIQDLASNTTVRETKARLIALGIIQEKQRSGGVSLILFNPKKLIEYLEGDPSKNEGDPSKNEGDPSKNEGDPSKNEGVIYSNVNEEKNAGQDFDAYKSLLCSHINQYADKHLRAAIAETGWNRENFMDSFCAFCFKSQKEFDKTPSSIKGLASLMKKHAQRRPGSAIHADHSSYEQTAGEIINACVKGWKKVSQYHDRRYGVDSKGKASISFYQQEKEAVKTLLLASRITKESALEMVEVYSDIFHPEFSYCWSDYAGNDRILSNDLSRMRQLQKATK